MKGFIIHNRLTRVTPCGASEDGDWSRIAPGQRVHHRDHEPLHHLHSAIEYIAIAASTAELSQISGPHHADADAVRRSPHVAPSPAVNGRCGIRLATGDRRPRRRRGRPLCPRSARGRPLTAEDGARNREYVIDDGTRRGGERPTRHQPPGRWGSFRFVTSWRKTTKHLPAGFMTHS
jgi:hypothetical protein